MGTKKNSDDDVGKTAETPLERCPKNFKPWILALVVMVIFTLGWAIYEAQQRGGGLGQIFKERFWERKGRSGEPTALNKALPGSAKALQTSYHGIIEDTRPAVISIDAVVAGQNANPGDAIANYTRIGSGVIIDPRGYALSSFHVVEGASSLKATVYGQAGALEYPLKIVKGDKTSDLVLLRIQGDRPFPHASLGDSNAVRTGDVVISIGSPFGFEQSVTSGIVSSRNRTVNVGGMVYENLIQTDSSINKGSSGGPLISAKGDVIGINTAIYSTSGQFAGISFAVPINRSLELLGGVVDFQNEPPPVAKGQLAAWGKTGKQIGNFYRLPDGQILTPPHNYRGACTDCHPQFLTQGIAPNSTAPGQGRNQVWGQRRYLGFGPGLGRGQGLGLKRNPGPWCPVAGPNNISLGMTVSDVDDVIANQNNMMRPGGVFVISLLPGMPADAAGLQRGDVIIRIDGRKIQDSAGFEKILETKGASSMDLVILRFGVRKTVKVALAQGGAAQPMAGTTPTKQPTEFTWLGGEMVPLPADNAGVSVAEAEGVLAIAGVKAGDIITGVNNQKVTDLNSFIELTTKVNIKKGFLLDVMRSGSPLYIAVKG